MPVTMRNALLALLAALTTAVPAAAQRAAEHRERAVERREERKEDRAEDKERHTRDPVVNEHQRRQAHRICRGTRKGSLTPDEARGLAAQEQALGAEEAAFKSDGQLTKAERETLRGQLDTLSRSIFEEKHDGEVTRVRARLADGATRAEAHEAAAKAHRLALIRQRLNGEVPEAERARLQTEHDALVDELFDVDGA